MFLKLVPVRRILVLIGLILVLAGNRWQFGAGDVGVTIRWGVIGFFLVFLVLMLELKDKLLAKDELEAGRAVQSALIPDQIPYFPGWEIWLYTRPANEVGGDLVDYIDLAPDTLGLVLGDVAGKGLGAALLMSKLQATIRALAPRTPSLDKLGNQMNDIFIKDGLPSKFISLVYLVIRSNSGEVDLLNAGHMPPYLVNPHGVKEIERGGTALGLSSQTRYKRQRLTLKENELMVIYSDGLTEARNAKDEFVGEARLLDWIQASQKEPFLSIGTSILERLDRFVGEAQPSDDLSLILLKRKQKE
jgi:serine phosphatase RsbU (regulator of sigma subunit)